MNQYEAQIEAQRRWGALAWIAHGEGGFQVGVFSQTSTRWFTVHGEAYASWDEAFRNAKWREAEEARLAVYLSPRGVAALQDEHSGQPAGA